ncbi:radical SAM protein [Photobacterium galatheae]|uniref:Radical SAM protein n=1 Tax=Photobacterium galatheae TaxID=1654360 RepID=A0A066RPJ4_9GAMM|nr:radical SAM protein [Photobacterium galatheae]KDM91036.1 hypothetical protein EA58_14910 [Photobacterium galatheae]MCM0149012.1 radical SAM protein [Photobacterium galatheae]
MKCKHCYIEPELFKSKERITVEHYKKVFDQVEKLIDIDHRLKNIEWEVIGGETTMMPFEFWEELLPYTLERIEGINKRCEKKGSLNFLTNLIYKDKRYTDLFNQYGDHDLFCLYTSWEPDTNRFGHNNKMYPKFKETLASIHAKEKILDIILTKTVCDMEPEAILEEFDPLGITDYSIKQLSPYGSGKEFFKHNMVNFDKMSDFLTKFQYAKNRRNATFTPLEEMYGALSHGTAFQCNGNFKYDLSIEPNGLTHFNANQTMGDMVGGFKPIFIDDEAWATRVLFENSGEETKKLTLKRDACVQCEYLRYCNAGWYHYKLLPEEEYMKFAQKECSGFKKVWDLAKQAGFFYNFTEENHLKIIQGKAGGQIESSLVISERDFSDNYDAYISKIGVVHELVMKAGTLYGKSPLERAIAYESLNLRYQIPPFNLLLPDLDMIHHIFSGVLPNAKFDQAQVWSLVMSNLGHQDLRIVAECYNYLAELFHKPLLELPKNSRFVPAYKDRRNEEVFKNLIRWKFIDSIDGVFIKESSDQNTQYLAELARIVFIEENVL